MLHGYEPLHARLTDRLGLREFVRERIGSESLPRLIASGRSAKALGLDSLSEPCVLKVNNGCGGHVFVRDPRTLDRQAAATYLDGLLRDNHYPRKREYHYKKIRPRLLAEELLLEHDGRLPSDFKFFMFSGEIGMLWVDIDRFGQHRRAIFDGHLDRIPYRFRGVRDDHDFRLPAAIDAMRDVARRLAVDIDFVRVDLYNIQDRILVGETTFTPGAGVILVNSPELDLEYGARWKLAASGDPDAAATPGRRRYEVPA